MDRVASAVGYLHGPAAAPVEVEEVLQPVPAGGAPEARGVPAPAQLGHHTSRNLPTTTPPHQHTSLTFPLPPLHLPTTTPVVARPLSEDGHGAGHHGEGAAGAGPRLAAGRLGAGGHPRPPEAPEAPSALQMTQFSTPGHQP